MTSGLPFAKAQSIGNDFVLVRAENLDRYLASSGRSLQELVVAICSRRFGVGSDGLLVYRPQGTLVEQRMFNPDGTEDFCGNGLRCTASEVVRRREAPREFIFHHLGIKIPCIVSRQGLVRTTLAPARWGEEDVPFVAECSVASPSLGESPVTRLRLTVAATGGSSDVTLIPVDTGSAHAVAFVSELPSSPWFEQASAAIESHPCFPERTSVIWTVVERRNVLRLRIWERGVGETLGCGTGSAASAAAYLRRAGRSGPARVRVHNPGGSLTYELPEGWAGPMTAIGRAETLFEGVWTG